MQQPAGRDLGIAVVTVVNLLSPTLVVLGGLAAAEDGIILDAVRTTVRARAFPVVRDAVRIERTTFGDLADAIGGAAIAREIFFYTSSGKSDRLAEGPDMSRTARRIRSGTNRRLA